MLSLVWSGYDNTRFRAYFLTCYTCALFEETKQTAYDLVKEVLRRAAER